MVTNADARKADTKQNFQIINRMWNVKHAG